MKKIRTCVKKTDDDDDEKSYQGRLTEMLCRSSEYEYAIIFGLMNSLTFLIAYILYLDIAKRYRIHITYRSTDFKLSKMERYEVIEHAQQRDDHDVVWQLMRILNSN